MRLREAFHVESWPDRPWAIVWDPQGFREPGCETFLTFWAWQDLSPRRLRREATHLADAWNGLRAVAQHWTTATEADWHAWIATMASLDRTPRQLARQVETLYRFYAFWHWYDPRRVPRLFWPSEPPARQRWLQQFWDAEYSREHQPLH